MNVIPTTWLPYMCVWSFLCVSFGSLAYGLIKDRDKAVVIGLTGLACFAIIVLAIAINIGIVTAINS